LIGEAPSKEKWRLNLFVTSWEKNASIGCRLNFFAFDVVAKIFNEQKKIVSSNMKPGKT
jgi:hypothetical protein